ncbi:MAG: hypothetical protein K9H16_08600 [Bacteroidales bacterium]|nr:hypothetical protein [Bacteroidales bacterium]
MMKTKITILLTLTLFVSSLAFAQKKSANKYLKPANFQEKIMISSENKARSYYALSTEKASIVSLRGPGILRIISRCAFTPSDKGKLDYEIVYTIDGGELQVEKFKGVSPTTKATFLEQSMGVPGALKDIEIELGRGEHTIQLFAKDSQPKLAVRYVFSPGKEKKKKWIAFSPVQPIEPVDLITRESIVNYSRFSMEKPLKIDVIGPTQVRVLTRVENHYNMRGRIQYRVQVKENDKVINTFSLSSKRSEVTFYSNDKKLLPGTACEFVIDVPKGKHTYEIMPLDKDKSTILGRFLIPEKDVKLSE